VICLVPELGEHALELIRVEGATLIDVVVVEQLAKPVRPRDVEAQPCGLACIFF
jgi:hypothetical protein